jgi:hypothetical protein
VKPIAFAFLFLLHASVVGAQSIEGVVVERGTGKPIQGAKITLFTASVPTFEFGSPSQTSGEIVADEQGKFAMSAKPGRYRVVPAKDGLVIAPPVGLQFPREPGTWVEIADQQTIKGLKLEMQAEASISGRVIDSKGNPVTGTTGSAALQVYRYNDYGQRSLAGIPGISYPRSAWSFVRPDDRGEFRLYGLPAGDFYLSVSGGGASTFVPGNTDEAHATTIHLEPGDSVQLGTIALPPPPVITKVKLQFTRDGSPFAVSLVNVNILPAGGLFATAGQRTEVEISLPPGSHEVVVSSGGFGVDGYYGRATVVVGATDVTQEVQLKSGIKLKGKFSMDDAAPERQLACRLVGSEPFSLVACNNTTAVPGHYRFGLQNLPAEAYIRSVKVGDRDILADGIQITGDTEFDIQLGSRGAELKGSVTNANGEIVANSIVALVPDAPLRAAVPLYKSGTTDIDGRFRLIGIAPGSYRLFAWTELPGPAYLNAEFMKRYEDAGKAVRIEKTEPLTVDVRLSDEEK